MTSIPVGTGDSVAFKVKNQFGADLAKIAGIADTSYTDYEAVFTAEGTNSNYMISGDFQLNEELWMNNLTLHAIDPPGTIISSAEGEMVQGIQWVDDDSSVAPMQDGANLTMTINGVTTQVDIADVSGQLQGALAWEMEMAQPIRVYSLVVSSLIGGTLYIWTA